MLPDTESRKTAEVTPLASGAILQFKIVLKGICHPIWRRFLVPEGLTLSGLHDVIQAVMGWTDSHLHQFVRKGVRYGVPDPDWDEEKIIEDKRVRLSALKLAVKDTLLYEYDFGDGGIMS